MKDISVDPEILGGIPVFTGTRVPAQSLFDHLQAGDSLADFLDSFPDVTREQAIRVLEASKASHGQAYSESANSRAFCHRTANYPSSE
jgi:uncharacterized protein (DUF433 family)